MKRNPITLAAVAALTLFANSVVGQDYDNWDPIGLPHIDQREETHYTDRYVDEMTLRWTDEDISGDSDTMDLIPDHYIPIPVSIGESGSEYSVGVWGSTGYCQAYFEGYVFWGQCVKQSTSGCSNPFKYSTLEQCQKEN